MRLPNYHRFANQLWPRSHAPLGAHRRVTAEIKQRAEQLLTIADAEIARRVAILRESVASGTSIFDREILSDCFALTFEAVRRTTSLSYYDVQILAGLALATGAIAEMKTGEGKTIVAAMPAALRSLTGRGVHVATVNSYLAQRDFELLMPAYNMLGMTAGLLRENEQPVEKQAGYLCDITYGTGYEFGFDYLRDQSAVRRRGKPLLGQTFRQRLRGRLDETDFRMQRGHAFAVIDEIDSVLIDEANTPLVLSGVASQSTVATAAYRRAAELMARLENGDHYSIDHRQRSISLTEAGQDVIFQAQDLVPDAGLVRPWGTYVEQALRAEMFLQRDVDYVVQDEQVMIVDQYTGRIFADRTWRDGLHQAVEFKEGVPVTPEKNSLARVSRQRYFGLYEGLCGMTGTATGHEAEFQQFYQLPVVVIPDRLPNQRKQFPARYFPSSAAKWQAIAADIRQRHAQGQPVLVGTRTIRESEGLSQLLRQMNVRHRVLNGTQTEDEATIVEQAGLAHAVVIATNMAGRGTDIRVSPEVAQLGGLHVVATQRQESRRVDRQLIGRAARQGLPGSYQFFVSAEDELVASQTVDLVSSMQKSAGGGQECPESFGRQLDALQRAAERRTYEARCNLYRQDRWLNEILSTVAEIDEPTNQDEVVQSA